MYLLLGCLRGLPTAEDHYFLYYTIMMRATFSQWYVVYMIPLFSFLAVVNYATGMDGTAAVLTALAYTYLYFLLFMLLAVHYMRYHEVEPLETPYYYGLNPFQQPAAVNPGQDFLLIDLEE